MVHVAGVIRRGSEKLDGHQSNPIAVSRRKRSVPNGHQADLGRMGYGARTVTSQEN